MKPLLQQPPLTLAAAGLAATALIALLGVLAPSSARLSAYDSVSVPSPKLLFPETVRQGAFESFAPVVDRPLFNADRQKDPSPLPLPGTQPALPSLDGYRLVGVIVTADRSLALVERRAANNVVKLKTGDNLDGRTVKDITAMGVTFSGSSATETLSIPKAVGAHFILKDTQKVGQSDSGTVRNKMGMGDRDTN